MLKLVPSVPEQRRNDVRIEIPRWPGEVWHQDPSAAMMQRGALLNISAGGALVALFQAVPLGALVRCRFRLPDGSLFSIPATVQRQEHQRHVQRGAWLGLNFVDLRVRDGDRLTRWIFAELARQRRVDLQKREVSIRYDK